MARLEKIGEICGYKSKILMQMIRTVEDDGFIAVDDNPSENNWKTYHVMVDKKFKKHLEEI
jgi:hypothetical protein